MKRIITCSDGTWNKIETAETTNVLKMFNRICHLGKDNVGNDVQQVKAYDEGVGAGYTLQDQLVGGITGAGLDKNIKDMYSFIAMNYNPGDEIYLFGFSRGAYTARSLAGFIRNCGLLKSHYYGLLDRAYDLYRSRNDYTTPDSDMMRAFRSNYCYEDITPIKFIGVWDTVGSLGIPLPSHKLLNQHKYKFHDVQLSASIEYAYHALALDEKRVLFEPTLWGQSEKVTADPNHPQVLEQRWFCGVHSNVGGGYLDCGISNIALQWLIEKAADAGLCFNEPPHYTATKYDKGEIMNSYTPLYWFWLPKPRKPFKPLYKHEANGKGNTNVMLETNEVVDESVFVRWDQQPKYRPQEVIDEWKRKNAAYYSRMRKREKESAF